MKKVIMIVAAAALGFSAAAQAPKFAQVNFAELVQLMPEMDSAREVQEAASKDAQEIYTSMVEEFQNKYSQYEQKAASWTQAIRESKEKELTDIQNRIQEFQQSIQQDLQTQQQQLMAPIYQKAQEAITNLAKEGGYAMVFDVQSALYIDPAQITDLTVEARKVLGIPEGRTLETLQAELQAKAAQLQ